MLFVILYVKKMKASPMGLYGPFNTYAKAEVFISKHSKGFDTKIIRPINPSDMEITK